MTANEDVIYAALKATKHQARYAAEELIDRYRCHCDVSRGPIPERCKAHTAIAYRLERELKRIYGDGDELS